MEMKPKATLVWKEIPELQLCHAHAPATHECGFGSLSMVDKTVKFEANVTQLLLKHPLAIPALLPKDAAVFAAGALSGAAAKTVTAPLDRIKLIMQVPTYPPH